MSDNDNTVQSARVQLDVPPGGTSILAALRGVASKKTDPLIMAFLIIFAVAFRIYSLQFFHVISTDGTGYVTAARALGRGELTGIGINGFYSVLIWIAGHIFPDLELAGRVVSIFSGSLLVVPLYLLGMDICSRQVALCAALLAVVWPPLVSSSCEVMTQATYDTIQLFGIYFVWRMFRQPTVRRAALAGGLLGLAYLTRPEGVLLFLVVPLPLLLLSYREFIADRRVPAAYGAGFLVLFALNVVLVHHITGEWQMSAKTDSALNDALSYYLNLPDLNYVPGYEPKGYLEIIREYPGFILINTLKNLRATWQTILPPWLWGLVVFGFLAGGFSREKNAINGFLVATLAPFAVIIVFYYVSPGYAEPYLPAFFLWGANGLVMLEKLAGKKLPLGKWQTWSAFNGRLPLAVAATAVYSLLVLSSQVRADIPDSAYHPDMDNGRRDEKRIGLLLKENLPPGKIMTRWARVAFYAEREWVNIPAVVNLDGVVRTAMDNKVRYLIADGMLYSNRPKLGREIFAPLVDPGQPYGMFFMSDPSLRIEGLKPVFLFTDAQSAGVVVYEIPSRPE